MAPRVFPHGSEKAPDLQGGATLSISSGMTCPTKHTNKFCQHMLANIFRHTHLKVVLLWFPHG